MEYNCIRTPGSAWHTWWNLFHFIFPYDVETVITHSTLIFHFSVSELLSLIGVMVSLCSCREVTGVGTEPQPLVSHPGTADSADHCALFCPSLPWHMTSLPSSGSGHTLLNHITELFIPYLYKIDGTSGFLYLDKCIWYSTSFCATITSTITNGRTKWTELKTNKQINKQNNAVYTLLLQISQTSKEHFLFGLFLKKIFIYLFL